ncbi:MAG: DNA-protecting protein DprA, partial [Proteobacteria bacterium]|nr:DNA-protecting protein DprA [Pseudomonadota bacterium]
LVENVTDIIDELSNILTSDNNKTIQEEKEIAYKNLCLNPEESRVLKALEPYPVHIDELARKLKFEPGKLLGTLLTLELQDLIKQEPGKLFSLRIELK